MVMLKKWQNEDGSFKGLSSAEFDALNETEQNEYHDAFKAESKAKEERLNKEISGLKEDADANKERIATLEAQVEVVKASNEILQLKMKGQSETAKTEEKLSEIGKALRAKADDLKEAISKGGSINFTVKATQDASDITSGTDFAQMLPGVGQIATRRPFIKDFIRVVSTNTEYIKYNDQETIVRDAKNVAGCATSTHTSKITWQVRTLQQKKVRDFVDVCLDMMDDYDFVEAEIRNLISTDIALKVDEGLLLGDGTGANINGIASYASTFNAANPVANYAASIQSAQLIDLICVAGAQIQALGENNKFMPNVALLNPTDAKKMRLLKDANDNYLLPNWVTSDGVTIDSMRIIENPLVPANQAYVMDSRMATIYQAKASSVEIATENRDNFEHELVTVKGYERLNLLVRNVDANAFMHIPDLAAGITAITAP